MTQAPKDLSVVILAGGVGTRLWPLSRSSDPKQFLEIFKDNGKTYSLIQLTAARLDKFLPSDQLFTVAPAKYSHFIRNQLARIPSTNIIEEPNKKGTTAAIVFAGLWVGQLTKNPKSVIHYLVADDHIENAAGFRKTIKESYGQAKKGKLVVFGVKPRYAATGYGYIKTSKEIGEGVFAVDRFIEKPNEATAQKYIEEGNYFWHGSGFMCRLDVLLDELYANAKETYKLAIELKKAFKLPTIQGTKKIQEIYSRFEDVPIEKVLHEKSRNVAMVQIEDTWSDLGDWAEVYEVFKKKGKTNVLLGDASKIIQIDSTDSMIYSGGRTIALVGLNDMVVIETEDALLVCPKNKAQKVKDIVNQLKKNKKDELL